MFSSPFPRDEIREWAYHRQIGRRAAINDWNRVTNQLYRSVQCIKSWNPRSTVDDTHHGSIFNFDFSKDGSLLVAACERKSLLVFDPFNSKLIQTKSNAHTDCVNCVRFLDSRTFATCSDDTTVCLWDVRYLKNKVRTLQGHSNWVKNIDYAHHSGVLMTSGFDGCIYTWDINRYSDQDTPHCHRIFHTNGLMRSKLSPDGTKLIMATAGGYLLVVHDLDLTRLPDDLAGFKPNMYRLTQMSQTQPRLGYAYNHLFTRKRNRVELISDFPGQDNAEMITSLEVHPQGWCVASRNTTNDEASEWTCVHDIQGSRDDYLDGEHNSDTEQDSHSLLASHKDSVCPQMSPVGDHVTAPSTSERITPQQNTEMQGDRGTSGCSRFTISINVMPPSPASSNTADSSTDSDSTSSGTQSSASSTDNNDSHEVSTTTRTRHEDLRDPSSDVSRNQPLTPTLVLDSSQQSLSLSFSSNSIPTTSGHSVFFLRSINQAGRSLYTNDYTIRQNVPRLKHYVEEPNVGRGFIKELCFSQDGRLICSPFGFGIRLLAFDSDCRELCDCVPDTPVQLHEVTSNMSHSREVVTCKFSPTHCLVVSGCLNGKVDFHQPVL